MTPKSHPARLTSPARRSAFFNCGLTGVFLACILTSFLCLQCHLPLLTMGAIVAVAIAIFLALVMVTKIVARRELIIYYHHEIAVVSGTALFLRLIHQPVLAYLDITVLGLGVFLACGRIGCLLVGCCHGRPSRWGITYNEHHAAAGFTHYYVGIPLFPVQALESLFAFGVVALGVRIVLHGSAPGFALTWYVIAYGFARFCFEFLRGDPDRPYFLGFSEAQWTSLVLMSLTVSSEFSGALPWRSWDLEVTLVLVCLMAAICLHRRFRKTPIHRLLHPHHVREVALALEFAASRPRTPEPLIRVGCTSLGIRISAEGHDPCNSLRYYALSRSAPPLTLDAAAVLAATMCRLKDPRGRFKLLAGNHGVFHCLVLRETDPKS
jgi:prolipoprotein diacylglyceryltransferase